MALKKENPRPGAAAFGPSEMRMERARRDRKPKERQSVICLPISPAPRVAAAAWA